MSDDGSERRRRIVSGLLDTAAFRGATGMFTPGSPREHDEGGIQFGVTHDGGKVIIDFGTSVSWLGMEPQAAADLGAFLLKHARLAAREARVTITIDLS